MTPKEILVAARARIEDPKNWTCGATARDRYGGPVRAENPSAVRWCAVGALLAEEPDRESALGHEAYLALFEVSGGPARLNDRGKHEAVLRMYDRAIDYLDKKSIV